MSEKVMNKQVHSSTGIHGLDDILRGGLPKNQIYLVQGKPGTGKTTLAMQFLLEGLKQKEKCLYITFSETKSELETVAQSHEWDLTGLSILELSTISENIGSELRNTLFHPSELELNRVIEILLNKVKEVNPTRIVIDSVSELRLLAETSHKYRRQMLSFKEFFIGRGSTVLFLDDMTMEAGDMHVQSIVHGVLLLEKLRAGYGVERREFHVSKMRGVPFRGGTHDYVIEKGGIVIFPRLVAANNKTNFSEFERSCVSTGTTGLDELLGGGLDSGTSNLILGPAGTGKSTIALQFAISAAESGKLVTIYSFEESISNLLFRAETLGLDAKKHIESGAINLQKIDPAELTPGQFSSLVREANEGVANVVIVDSLNGYIHAMPEQQFLMLQLHELLSHLGNRGVITLLVLSQAGIMGNMQTPLDLTYLADSVILTRFFEAFGRVKKAISVLKKRTGSHEEALREFRLGPGGIIMGDVLEDFSGIFSGIPKYLGIRENILDTGNE
jgi:circadian clock protein KaiC